MFCTVLFLILITRPVLSAGKHLLNQPLDEHIKPAIEYYISHKKEGDQLYIYSGAYSAYKYYAIMMEIEDDEFVKVISSTNAPYICIKSVDSLTENTRIWVLFSHISNRDGVNEKELILSHINSYGEKIDTFFSYNSSIYLYNYNPKKDIIYAPTD